MKSCRRVLLAVLVGCLVAGRATAQDRRPPTVDDLLDLVQVSAPQISPDGSRILFTKSELGPWKDNKPFPPSGS